MRKTARLRNKGDNIVKSLHDFSSNESGDIKKSLEGIAECLSALEDCNHLKVRVRSCAVLLVMVAMAAFVYVS